MTEMKEFVLITLITRIPAVCFMSLPLMSLLSGDDPPVQKLTRRFLKEKIHSIRLFFLIQTDSAS